MEEAIKILQEIKETNSTNDKLDILKNSLPNQVLETILHYSNNDIKFGVNSRTLEKAFNIKSLEGFEDVGEWIEKNNLNSEIDEMLDFTSFHIDMIIKDCIKLSGNNLIGYIRELQYRINPNKLVWISRMLLKNLRIGMSVTQINKALQDKKLRPIDVFVVQLCKKVDEKEWEKIQYPNHCEIKYDGIRCIAKIKPKQQENKANLTLFCEENDNIHITLLSRRNKDITSQFPEVVLFLRDWCILNNINDIILDGEIIDTRGFNDLQKRLGRKPENIEFNINLNFVVFDILYETGTNMKVQPFDIRRLSIIKFTYNNSIQISESETCENKDQLLEYYNLCLKKGYEGIVIKDFDGLYAQESKDERKGAWKLKPEYDYDIKIIGFEYGTGRLNNVVSILHLLDEENKIKSSIGTGLSDKDREELTKHKDKLIGMTAEIKYGEMSLGKDGYKSFRWPVFKTLRWDK